MKPEFKKKAKNNGKVKRDPSSLFETYHNYVFNIALGKTKNYELAQDITQNVFVMFLEKKASLPPNCQEQDIKNILYRVCTNHTFNVIKKNKIRLRYEKASLGKNKAWSSPKENTLDNQLLRQHIQMLDDKLRRPLLMRYFENRTFADIAKTLGVPLTTAKNRVRKGLDLLQYRLKNAGFVVALPALENHLGHFAEKSLDLAKVFTQKISSTLNSPEKGSPLVSVGRGHGSWSFVKGALISVFLVSFAFFITDVMTTSPERPKPKLLTALVYKAEEFSFDRRNTREPSELVEFHEAPSLIESSNDQKPQKNLRDQNEERVESLAGFKVDDKELAPKYELNDELLLITKKEVADNDNPNKLLEKEPLKTVDEAEKLPPVAKAGRDQKVTDDDGNGKESVRLDGSESYDPDGTLYEELQFFWLRNKQLIAIGDQPTVSLRVGTHELTLQVIDKDALTGEDTAQVTVSPPTNNFPVAVARYSIESSGPTEFSLWLDASASSDKDLDSLTFTWNEVTNPSQPLEIYSGNVSRVLVQLSAGYHQVELKVTDNGIPPLTAQTTLSFILDEPDENPDEPDEIPEEPKITEPPVALATLPDSVLVEGPSGQGLVIADASASFDPDGGEIQQYDWYLETVADAESALLSSGSDPVAEFYLGEGTFSLKLCVTDDEGEQGAQFYIFTVTLGSPPIAEIDADVQPFMTEPYTAYLIQARHFLYLDASNSSDPEGGSLQYLWQYKLATEDEWAVGSTEPTFDFSTPDPKLHQVRLQVKDEQGNLSEHALIYVQVFPDS